MEPIRFFPVDWYTKTSHFLLDWQEKAEILGVFYGKIEMLNSISRICSIFHLYEDQMSNQIDNSVVRIFAIDEDIAARSQVLGAGFLVSDKHIVTCAHV